MLKTFEERTGACEKSLGVVDFVHAESTCVPCQLRSMEGERRLTLEQTSSGRSELDTLLCVVDGGDISLRVGSEGVWELKDGTRVTAVKDARQSHPVGKGRDYRPVECVGGDLTVLLKVDWVGEGQWRSSTERKGRTRADRVVVARLPVAVGVLDLSSVSRVVQEETVTRPVVRDEPLERSHHVLSRRVRTSSLVVRQDDEAVGVLHQRGMEEVGERDSYLSLGNPRRMR